MQMLPLMLPKASGNRGKAATVVPEASGLLACKAHRVVSRSENCRVLEEQRRKTAFQVSSQQHGIPIRTAKKRGNSV